MLLVEHHQIFQFHNGTIKTKGAWRQMTIHLQFQFHNGTIKTQGQRVKIHDKSPKFQFHNGTIKTLQLSMMLQYF